MAGKSGKARAFAFLIYPDSWPNWREDLSDLHMPVVVSPLHDEDVFQKDDEDHVAGEMKKPHYHAIISWGNATTLRNALNVLSPFGVSHVEPVGSYSGYCRYLCHMDDPDKAQYDPADVVCLGGAVPDYERKLTQSEILKQRDEIMDLCVTHGIYEYAELCLYCCKHHPDWRQDVYQHPVFWKGFLESLRFMLNQQYE